MQARIYGKREEKQEESPHCLGKKTCAHTVITMEECEPGQAISRVLSKWSWNPGRVRTRLRTTGTDSRPLRT